MSARALSICPATDCARQIGAQARVERQRSDCAIRGSAHHEVRADDTLPGQVLATIIKLVSQPYLPGGGAECAQVAPTLSAIATGDPIDPLFHGSINL